MAENVRPPFETRMRYQTKPVVLIHYLDPTASNPKGYALGFSQQDEPSKAKAASRAQPDGETKELS